jgi:FkbM family methyltransferase
MMLFANAKRLFKIIQRSAYARALFFHRVAAGVEHANLLNGLRAQNFQTVVDIGANRGQFALVAHQSFPNAKIYSFEPLREPAAVFRRIFSSTPAVTLHEIAIGPVEEQVTIHVSAADDSSSLLPISNLQSSLFPGTAEKETRTIQAKPLDAVLDGQDIRSPAFLKMDVQGFEKAALDGCQTLLPLFSHLYIECSFLELYEGQALADQIIDWLRQNGFVLSGVYNLSCDKKGLAVQADFLFIQQRKNSMDAR